MPVHPHVRGEYDDPFFWIITLCGSPPRAWGIRRLALGLEQAPRFTPTCVGNTPCRPARLYPAPVHPHVRGEYDKLKSSINLALRFTPTCVGNTWPICCPIITGSVHPHVRGEYYARRSRTKRTRRFTPTCVGNTRRSDVLA